MVRLSQTCVVIEICYSNFRTRVREVGPSKRSEACGSRKGLVGFGEVQPPTPATTTFDYLLRCLKRTDHFYKDEVQNILEPAEEY